MYKRLIIAALCLVVLAICSHFSLPLHTETADGTSYEHGIITQMHRQAGTSDSATVKIQSGPDSGKVEHASVGALTMTLDVTPPLYQKGDSVLVTHDSGLHGEPNFVIIDRYRLSLAVWLFAFVIILAIAFAGWRGVGSLAGLIVSLLVIGKFVIPQIIQGHNPYLITSIGTVVISLIGIYIAHGFSKRTSIALVSTYITLALAVGFSALVVHGLHLSGIAGEDLFYLEQKMPGLNIQGVLLCGMILSMIGILDDITVGQATAIEELQKANPKLTVRELYSHGIKIGREHIASLINTLVLAYVGTSFLFIVYISATSLYPLMVNLNSEIVMEEIARSLIGSCVLILAVPITTLLAARLLKQPTTSRIAKKAIPIPTATD